MAVFSRFINFKRFELISRLIKKNVVSTGQTVRCFHANEFPMRPSVYNWRQFKDFLHFYTMIGVIPITIIATYVNITVGPAELADIPEGYEPKHWEYYKSPISRFFAKWCIKDKREEYEKMVSFMSEESEKIILRKIEKMVRDFMSLRNDYQSWYYRPIDAYHLRYDREEWKYVRDNAGHKSAVAEEDIFSDGGNPK